LTIIDNASQHWFRPTTQIVPFSLSIAFGLPIPISLIIFFAQAKDCCAKE
jgi:hypothetical protein